MLEIIKILDMQQQKVEADIAALSRQSNRYLLEISTINENIANKFSNTEGKIVLEKWRANQKLKILAKSEKLNTLSKQILDKKQDYKKILAQNIAAKDMASIQQSAHALSNEEQENSRALDALLLSKMP